MDTGVRVAMARRTPVASKSAGTLAELISGLSPVSPITMPSHCALRAESPACRCA
jgi:hypothetical protein